MDIKGLQLDGLVLAHNNIDLKETFYLDFDGEEDVSYNNNVLNINIDIDTINADKPDFTKQEQFQIITDLNTGFENTGFSFTVGVPEQTKDTESSYRNFSDLIENINLNIMESSDNKISSFDSSNTASPPIDKTTSWEAGDLFVYQPLSNYNVSLPSYTSSPEYLISFHTWNQNGDIYLEEGGRSTIEYWEYTPEYNNSKTYTGCTATATAQLLYYWGDYQLNNGYQVVFDEMSFDDTDKYTTSSLGISIDDDYQSYSFSSFSTLNNELSTIEYLFNPEEIAAFSFGVGIKIESDYNIDGTGAYVSNVADFLLDNGFADTTYLYDPDGLQNSESIELASEIIDDVTKGQVVLVSIWKGNAGHAVLIDGYDSVNDKYHYNMGWGGYEDGWYSLNDVPGTYTEIREIVYNVFPEMTAVTGFTEIVSSGLSISRETVESGTQTILAGGATVSNTIINNGVQAVSSGGTTTSTTINSGGIMHVYSGATASNTTNLNGIIGVGDGGTAVSTTLDSGGNMIVWGGGVVIDSIINYQGVVTLSSGATANSTTINSNGGMNVFSGAVASSATVNQSGYLGIGDGAVASDTTIGYAGALTVWAGGVIEVSTIETYGAIILSSGAVASGTTVNSLGGLNVYSGAVASTTTVNQGGYLGVGLGATTYDTTIGYAGALTVWGGGVVHSNTIEQWGAIILSSGAVANSTTINSQGGLHIYSGASAYTTQINSGADLGIGSGGLLYGSTESYGASVIFYEGARIGGWNTFAGSVTLAGGLDASGSYVSFDISNRSTGDGYILNNLGNLYNATLSVKTDSSQAVGRYCLSSGAAGFTGSLTVYEGDSDKGTVSLNQSLTVDNHRYDLQLLNNELYLDISSSVSQAVSSMQTSESTTFAALSAYPDSISSDAVGCQPLWTQNEYWDMAFSDTSSLYTSQGCISSGILAS